MRHIILSIALITSLLFGTASAQEVLRTPIQKANPGYVHRLHIPSSELRSDWVIDVWTPEGYDADSTKRYPVIYMHDGQNLYDPETTWNHQAWEMDSVTSALIDRGVIQAPIIVGIHSRSETRIGDLMPQKAAQDANYSKADLEGFAGSVEIRGDAYLRYIVELVKPTIDYNYRTLRDAANTTVMGSSMGGLMSIYALCEYPDVFGNAICMSTHWVGMPDKPEAFAMAMYEYLHKNLPTDGKHRLYFDHGTETIDSYYGPWEELMLALIRSYGYKPGQTLMNYIDYGAAHNEEAWAARVAIPLTFILGK